MDAISWRNDGSSGSGYAGGGAAMGNYDSEEDKKPILDDNDTVITIDSEDDDEDVDVAAAIATTATARSGYNESDVRDALRRFGHTQLRGLQEPALRSVMGGLDTVVLLPTGGGKSLCFQLPALLLGGLVVVVSPLLALMQDQVQALRRRGIRVELFCSLVTAKEMRETQAKLLRDADDPNHRDRIELLYTTPETLRKDALQTLLKVLYHKRALSLVAIDEAHCISSWGPDFRPAYLQLSTIRTLFPLVPIMALTATATARVRQDIHTALLLRSDAKVLMGDFNRANISYTACNKDSLGNAVDALYQFIKRCHDGSVGIVYVHRRLDTEALVAELQQKDAALKVAPYHAEIPLKKREKTLIDWLHGHIDIICATIAFGMGIDHPSVRFVVHWNMPKSMENLYQESGRAGRDGYRSHHVLMYSHDEYQRFRDLLMLAEQELREKEQRRGKVANPSYAAGLREKLKRLERVMQWATAGKCRRQQVLAYFEQMISTQQCQKTCDACENALQFDKLAPLTSHRPAPSVAAQGRQTARPVEAFFGQYDSSGFQSPVYGRYESVEEQSVYPQFSGTSQATPVALPRQPSFMAPPRAAVQRTPYTPPRATWAPLVSQPRRSPAPPSVARRGGSIRDYMAATEPIRTAYVRPWRDPFEVNGDYADSDEDEDAKDAEVKWVKTESTAAPHARAHLLPALASPCSSVAPRRVKRARVESSSADIIVIDSDSD